MKNLIFSLFAISLAGVAAIAATTAMLNTPVHRMAPTSADKSAEGKSQNTTESTTESAPAPSPTPASERAPRGNFPDADRPLPGKAPPPEASPSAASKPATEAAPSAASAPDDEKEDKDPYEGIAPEDLPPDLQYDADASVSFPTNT